MNKIKLLPILTLLLLITQILYTTVPYTQVKIPPTAESIKINESISTNHSNFTIEKIADGHGILITMKNIGQTPLKQIKISINISGGFLIKLKKSSYEIPILQPTESTSIKIKIFGIGIGKFTSIPLLTIKINTQKKSSQIIKISTQLFGPFTKIQSINYDEEAYHGYILFSPEYSTKTLLTDKQNIVHTWQSSFIQGLGITLLENGNILRTALPYPNPVFSAGGATGRVEIIDWNSTLLWSFEYSNETHCLHHDIEILPNGNILMIAWEHKTAQQAINAGRNPIALPAGELWPDHIIEVQPTSKYGGTIVWAWHVWDHLIQDYDSTKANYGIVANHPELIDINFDIEFTKYRADWNHINSLDFNPDFNQILLSTHNQNEIWVIDHSTTAQEASGHTGGTYGKGGDLLYRWGNPRAYQAGYMQDQKLYGQHDAQWIQPGCPGEGNILIFNNGRGRPNGQYSSIEEIIPPVDKNGYYYKDPEKSYGPTETTWTYIAENPFDFFAAYLSSTQRLPNGNTLICDGDHGVFFEVTKDKKTVWTYTNSVPNIIHNQVFKIICYSPDYPGLKDIIE